MTDATGVVSALTALGKLSTTPWEAAMPSTAAAVMVWRLTWFACCSASMPEGYWWPCSTREWGVAVGIDCFLQTIPAASSMPGVSRGCGTQKCWWPCGTGVSKGWQG